MSTDTNTMIARVEYDAQDLVSNYPPKFRSESKRVLWEHVSPVARAHHGRLSFSRWRAHELPQKVTLGSNLCQVEMRPGFFEYQQAHDGSALVEWYLNFANCDLFCAYGSAPFAQDENQVAEHPVLASLREALVYSGAKPLTVERGNPTPVLVTGAERLCSISTDVNTSEGRPHGMYGRQFEMASPETIIRSTRILPVPTVSNLIAIEAPSYGEGSYTREQIEYILATALTGFSAARSESISLNRASEPPIVVIHTGFWGCGAYGGNRVMMSLLQLLAANAAGIDRIVFHTGDANGSAPVEAAISMLDQLFGGANDERPPQGAVFLGPILSVIQQLNMKWGVSDGN